MITLYRFKSAWGLPDLSPFCVKVENYLRMTGVPFECALGDARKAPKQKLPYIDDGGTLIDDSRDIIDHFEAKLENPLDRGLSEADRALTVAFRALLESEAYFYAVYVRWQLDAGWKVCRPVLREYGIDAGIPRFLLPLVLPMIRKGMLRSLWGQGAGRYTRAQIEARLSANIAAVSSQLGQNRYFLGDQPRTIDATVLAFIWSLLDAPFESPVRDHARQLGNLVAYCTRLRETYYAEPARTHGASRPVVGNAA